MSNDVIWLNGWQRASRGWTLEAVVHDGSQWGTRLLPAGWLQQSGRLFEPSARPFQRLASTSFRVKISDLMCLSPLLNPGYLLGARIPAAGRTRQAVYVLESEGGRVFLPAALLLRELWMWSASATDALLTPNSLSLCLGLGAGEQGPHVAASGALAHAGRSDTGLRRLCWLAQSADAQASWASVLTFAHEGALRMKLPRASFEAWVWGVELPAGVLVAELSAESLSFDLPQGEMKVRLGAAAPRQCPPPAERRTGFLRFT